MDLHAQYQGQSGFESYIGLVYSGIDKSSKIYTLTSYGMRVIQNCNKNPPLDENGQKCDTMLPHFHTGIIEEDLYRKVSVGRTMIDIQVIDWRF